MAYLIIFIALLITELIYFRIADRFNIIDKPNLRSSHDIIVLRGGGIIFTISLLVYFFLHQLAYPWFILGLTIVAGVSFADDVKHQPSLLRFVLQMASATCLLYQLHAMDLFYFGFINTIIALFVIVFFINAYNFMDGINGITTGYSVVVLSSIFYLNSQLKLFNNDAIIYLWIGNLIFFTFNFRRVAKCFAGDVGSIAMGFSLLFFVLGFILKKNTPIFILLFSVYLVDAGLTIFQRLLKKENIFKAHRKHLYQHLANEKKWPQLRVSAVYMALQAFINLLVCLFWQKNILFQSIFTAVILVCLVLIYILAKHSVSKCQ